jgi:hypothetical protein
MLNLLLGLQLEKMEVPETNKRMQIFVRTNDNESLRTYSSNLRIYGIPSKVYSLEALTAGELDKKAKAIHLRYLEKRRTKPDFGSEDADENWENLFQEYKDSNRKVADHMGVKLRGIGVEVVAKNDPRPEAVFREEELDILSKLEHQRWSADRSLAGWIYGKAKSASKRKTPYLTKWKKLTEEIKDYDREVVKSIPVVLGTLDLKMVRRESN